MTTAQRTASQVIYGWDTTDPQNPGWYAEVRDANGDTITDSMKGGFPVDVDVFPADDGTGASWRNLTQALRDAYPNARLIDGPPRYDHTPRPETPSAYYLHVASVIPAPSGFGQFQLSDWDHPGADQPWEWYGDRDDLIAAAEETLEGTFSERPPDDYDGLIQGQSEADGFIVDEYGNVFAVDLAPANADSVAALDV